MKVLVTGASGVVGQGVVAALLKAGHSVRILSRNAEDEARQWPNVEPFIADVSDPSTLQSSADGCEVVVHIAGIVNESPEQTFEDVNVQGTANIVTEAERAGVKRFIFVSSLNADSGTSQYHQSKRKAELKVHKFSGEWIILRPSTIFGPGDEVISTLLTMVRTLPAVPLIDAGNDRFQPLWYQDFGNVVERALAINEIQSQAFDLGGPELTSMSDLLDRLCRITGRDPVRLPIPSFLAQIATNVAQKAGVKLPIDESKLQMLKEENFVSEDGRSAVTDVFGITPTPLDTSLQMLADAVHENLPEDGVGEMTEKKFWIEIQNSKMEARELLQQFRIQFAQLVPLDFGAEPDSAQKIKIGTTLTANLPMRGNIQIRLERLTPKKMTFLTLEGHPLAGVLEFISEKVRNSDEIRFTIFIHTRASNFFDYVGMKTLGNAGQNFNWRQVLSNILDLSGGIAPKGIQEFSRTLTSEEAEEFDLQAKELVERRKQSEAHKVMKKDQGSLTHSRNIITRRTAKG